MSLNSDFKPETSFGAQQHWQLMGLVSKIAAGLNCVGTGPWVVQWYSSHFFLHADELVTDDGHALSAPYEHVTKTATKTRRAPRAALVAATITLKVRYEAKDTGAVNLHYGMNTICDLFAANGQKLSIFVQKTT